MLRITWMNHHNYPKNLLLVYGVSNVWVRQVEMVLSSFFSDATGELKSRGKNEQAKWYIDTSRKHEWYDDSASKPASLTLEVEDRISFAMYEISENGTLTLGLDNDPKSHIFRTQGNSTWQETR